MFHSIILHQYTNYVTFVYIYYCVKLIQNKVSIYIVFKEAKQQMASAKEQFDEEMLKIITFVFRIFYTNYMCDDPHIIAIKEKMSGINSDYDMTYIVDITDDQFWDNIFRTMIILVFYWNVDLWTIYYLHNQLQITACQITEVFRDTRLLDDNGRQFISKGTFHKMMGIYICLFYNTRYKDKIRNLIQDEFLFSPK